MKIEKKTLQTLSSPMFVLVATIKEGAGNLKFK